MLITASLGCSYGPGKHPVIHMHTLPRSHRPFWLVSMSTGPTTYLLWVHPSDTYSQANVVFGVTWLS